MSRKASWDSGVRPAPTTRTPKLTPGRAGRILRRLRSPDAPKITMSAAASARSPITHMMLSAGRVAPGRVLLTQATRPAIVAAESFAKVTHRGGIFDAQAPGGDLCTDRGDAGFLLRGRRLRRPRGRRRAALEDPAHRRHLSGEPQLRQPLWRLGGGERSIDRRCSPHDPDQPERNSVRLSQAERRQPDLASALGD